MTGFLNELVQNLSDMLMVNMWIAPVIALLAGVITSFSPCCLSTVPLVIGYVGGASGKNTKRAFWLSATFSLGMAVTFTALGAAAAILGKILQRGGSWWYLILGVLMVLMALQTWEIYNFIPSTNALSKSKKRGFLGAFLAGVLGGFFSSPCATPALVVLLAYISQQGNVVFGIFLLLLYSIGHSTLVMIAGTSVGFVQRLSASEKYGKASKAIKIITGLAMLLLAFYLFYLAF